MKKKIGQGMLMATLVLGGGAATAFSAHAATTVKTPMLESVTDKTKTSVTLPIQATDLKSKEVKVSVEVTNKSTSKVTTTTKTLTLDVDGKGMVKVGSLHANTKYSFHVKVKENKTGAKYSKFSKSHTVTTSK